MRTCRSSVVVRQVPMIEQCRELLLSQMRRRLVSRVPWASNRSLLDGEKPPAAMHPDRLVRGGESSIAMPRYIILYIASPWLNAARRPSLFASDLKVCLPIELRSIHGGMPLCSSGYATADQFAVLRHGIRS